MRTRQIIKATVIVEVDASSPEEAYENFGDGLDKIDGLYDLMVTAVEQSEKPYAVPAGAERWAAAAKAIRLDDDHENRGDGKRLWGSYDGSWWWTNGHVMLRCEGSAPSESEWRRIPDKDFEKAIAPKVPRASAVFGDVERLKYGAPFRRSKTAPPIAISDDYFILASTAAAAWTAPTDIKSPFCGYDAEGKLVAVVMPMKVDAKDLRNGSREPSPCASTLPKEAP